ncbi:ACT domain-containing protein [Candidatus Nitrosotalea okcheonensis]|uniref:ACT domain-containing protein n=1 Tax=Candidatus Nitrosotalea okcheonensis TaxID=1903276 RepID=A0A2H1FH20_9ARCH|nr:ACT domain-containing protein [Candidatus Nitrosotalea okcheonensis]MDE1727703.1 ACT domain-containing protein [Nitrososphaerota archaeon]MDH2908350.1 ACT domain-containing protein [Candidatus Nitrosotalea sp.]MDE1813887.1 ACT domain-containing protein [Nitrososphaerota archaeon]MDE1831706.1 ACT domain-containing protein [Nitrososphaerota archaeon]MDE1877730.1 ACT domain-containing protein [Nitrososphaerota archaeon]
MRTPNLSVPDAVREIITKNRSIYDCIKMGLINYTSLAIKLQKEVESQVGGPVNPNTIVVAIKRYADSFEKKDEMQNETVLKNARLSLTDGIVDIKFFSEDFEMKDAIDLMDRFMRVDPDYEFFRSTDSFRFLTEDISDVRKILESFSSHRNFFQTGLAKITIHIPESEHSSDVVSYVSEILHDNGIELFNAFFGQDYIVTVLHEKDAARAYQILRSEISR